jgi:protocatechuate 3,4-dioxygenase beta subunit
LNPSLREIYPAAGHQAFATPGAFAQELVQTPAQTQGPYYPDKLPLDTDNDLLVINNNITPAVGEITYLSGRILDSSGDPVRNAVIEIWQPRPKLSRVRKISHWIDR